MPTLQRGEVQLHYEISGQGLPVVYICGFGSHGADTLGQITRSVLGEQTRLLVVDNRGSGRTQTPPGAVATIDDMADDVAAVMAHEGLDSAHILGVSMGGCVALTLAAYHPQRVRSLIAAVTLSHSPPMPNRSAFMLQSLRDLRDRKLPPDVIARFTALFLLGEQPFEYEPLMQVWVNAPPDPLEQTPEGFLLQKAALERYDLRPHLSRITAPTLVMSSPDDVLVPPRFQDELAAAIPSAQLKHYPGGHVFMLLPMYSPTYFADALAFWSACEQA
jgi:pimeloyl-ACP methyl ester carboxylesterase